MGTLRTPYFRAGRGRPTPYVGGQVFVARSRIPGRLQPSASLDASGACGYRPPGPIRACRPIVHAPLIGPQHAEVRVAEILAQRGPLTPTEILPEFKAVTLRGAALHKEPLTLGTLRKKMDVRVSVRSALRRHRVRPCPASGDGAAPTCQGRADANTSPSVRGGRPRSVRNAGSVMAKSPRRAARNVPSSMSA